MLHLVKYFCFLVISLVMSAPINLSEAQASPRVEVNKIHDSILRLISDKRTLRADEVEKVSALLSGLIYESQKQKDGNSSALLAHVFGVLEGLSSGCMNYRMYNESLDSLSKLEKQKGDYKTVSALRLGLGAQAFGLSSTSLLLFSFSHGFAAMSPLFIFIVPSGLVVYTEYKNFHSETILRNISSADELKSILSENIKNCF